MSNHIVDYIKAQIKLGASDVYIKWAKTGDHQFENALLKLAEWGYSLASEQLLEKDKEIEKIGNESLIFEMDLLRAKERIKELEDCLKAVVKENAIGHHLTSVAQQLLSPTPPTTTTASPIPKT